MEKERFIVSKNMLEKKNYGNLTDNQRVMIR